jgi:mRNA deadenylase 3'-5' endonuclease subunit Ccr4
MSTSAPISPPLSRRSLPSAGPRARPETLKVLTWNVAALRTIPSKLGTTEFQDRVKRTDVLKEFFQNYDVDIACLQEHKFSGWDKLDKEYACVDGSP